MTFLTCKVRSPFGSSNLIFKLCPGIAVRRYFDRIDSGKIFRTIIAFSLSCLQSARKIPKHQEDSAQYELLWKDLQYIFDKHPRQHTGQKNSTHIVTQHEDHAIIQILTQKEKTPDLRELKAHNEGMSPEEKESEGEKRKAQQQEDATARKRARTQQE